MLDLYTKSELSEEKDRISRAMGSFSDVAILEKVLAFAISDKVNKLTLIGFVGIL